MFWILLAAAAACLVYFSGCSAVLVKPNDSDDSGGGELAEQQTDADYPVTVAGTEIDAFPRRLVTLTPSMTEIVCEVSADGGGVAHAGRITGRGDYCDYPPEVLPLPTAGSGALPDIAKLSRIAPDAVLTSAPMSAKDEMLLLQNGVKVIYIPAPTDFSGLRDLYRDVGTVLFGKALGVTRGDAAFQPLQELSANPHGYTIGSFLYVTEDMLFAGAGTLEDAVLTAYGVNAGGVTGGYSRLLGNPERGVFTPDGSAVQEPDFILLNNKYSIDDLRTDKYYSQLTAVVKGKVIRLNGALFESPSGRLAEIEKTIKIYIN